jgi:hypothetical protein
MPTLTQRATAYAKSHAKLVIYTHSHLGLMKQLMYCLDHKKHASAVRLLGDLAAYSMNDAMIAEMVAMGEFAELCLQPETQNVMRAHYPYPTPDPTLMSDMRRGNVLFDRLGSGLMPDDTVSHETLCSADDDDNSSFSSFDDYHEDEEGEALIPTTMYELHRQRKKLIDPADVCARLNLKCQLIIDNATTVIDLLKKYELREANLKAIRARFFADLVVHVIGMDANIWELTKIYRSLDGALVIQQ